MIPIIDFPKLKSPFVRVKRDGLHVVTPQIEDGYEWVFDDGVKAVDKLNGTNICINIRSGLLETVDNRTNRLINNPHLSVFHSKNTNRVLKGILHSFEKKWVPLTESGTFYGELIAPDINGNLHETDIPMFVPFDFLDKTCHWNSWYEKRYPKNFAMISDWFKDLHSLFSKRYLKKDVLAEGLVFVHPDGRMAKLRRDMFDWYHY